MGNGTLSAATKDPFRARTSQVSSLAQAMMDGLQSGAQTEDAQIGVEAANGVADLIQVIVAVKGHRHNDGTTIYDSTEAYPSRDRFAPEVDILEVVGAGTA